MPDRIRFSAVSPRQLELRLLLVFFVYLLAYEVAVDEQLLAISRTTSDLVFAFVAQLQ